MRTWYAFLDNWLQPLIETAIITAAGIGMLTAIYLMITYI